MARKYFPNNWKEYKDADDEMFIPHTFEELMTWKVANWELPSSVACIVRVMNTKTRKVSEHVCDSKAQARSKINAIVKDPDIELVVVDHQAIHYLVPQSEDD